MKSYLQEMRLKNWVKNIFVFVPLVFSLGLFNREKLLATLIAFVAFCLVSSAVYMFNDMCDIDKDRAHPVKQNRPIASGVITVRKAFVFATLLAGMGIAISFCVNVATGILVVSYLALNLTYTLKLKHQPILDCFCIAAGFVLRVYAGGEASAEPVSDWLFLTVTATSLFMAFGKRRGELAKVGGSSTREVLQWYNAVFLNGMVFVCAGLSIVFYSLWAMYRASNMIYTVPLVIFMVSKYLLLIHDDNSHGDPTAVLFGDKPLCASAGLYGLLTMTLLYFGRDS